MQRDKAYLLDILESAKLAVEYVGERKREEFLKDTQCQDAVIRRLEIIGEAAGRISGETRSAFPNLPWKEMIGMRNVMVHEYDGIDMVIVWDTVKSDVPALIALLEKTISSLS